MPATHHHSSSAVWQSERRGSWTCESGIPRWSGLELESYVISHQATYYLLPTYLSAVCRLVGGEEAEYEHPIRTFLRSHTTSREQSDPIIANIHSWLALGSMKE